MLETTEEYLEGASIDSTTTTTTTTTTATPATAVIAYHHHKHSSRNCTLMHPEEGGSAGHHKKSSSSSKADAFKDKSKRVAVQDLSPNSAVSRTKKAKICSSASSSGQSPRDSNEGCCYSSSSSSPNAHRKSSTKNAPKDQKKYQKYQKKKTPKSYTPPKHMHRASHSPSSSHSSSSASTREDGSTKGTPRNGGGHATSVVRLGTMAPPEHPYHEDNEADPEHRSSPSAAEFLDDAVAAAAASHPPHRPLPRQQHQQSPAPTPTSAALYHHLLQQQQPQPVHSPFAHSTSGAGAGGGGGVLDHYGAAQLVQLRALSAAQAKTAPCLPPPPHPSSYGTAVVAHHQFPLSHPHLQPPHQHQQHSPTALYHLLGGSGAAHHLGHLTQHHHHASSYALAPSSNPYLAYLGGGGSSYHLQPQLGHHPSSYFVHGLHGLVSTGLPAGGLSFPSGPGGFPSAVASHHHQHPSSSSAAAAGATSSPPSPPLAPDGFPARLPLLLSVPEDHLRLSAHQVLLRQQIECFAATDDDVTTHTRGRNKPIVLKQVGIRCVHCKHISVNRRQKGSTYYPAGLLGLYQAAQNMSTTHLQCGLCPEMPETIKQQFAELLGTKNACSGAGRPYWARTAEQLGLVDTEEGIRFFRDVPPGLRILHRDKEGASATTTAAAVTKAKAKS